MRVEGRRRIATGEHSITVTFTDVDLYNATFDDGRSPDLPAEGDAVSVVLYRLADLAARIEANGHESMGDPMSGPIEHR